MKIKTEYKRRGYNHINDIVLMDQDEYFFEYNSNTKLLEILNGHRSDVYVYFTNCYELSSIAIGYEECLPFIIKKDLSVCWNAKYEDIFLEDFINTFEFDTVEVNVFSTPSGGFETIKNAVELWDSVYPLFEQIIHNLSMLFVAEQAIKRICSVYKKRKISPFHVLDIIYLRKHWNSVELSKILNIDKEDTKHFLLACGYRWNNSTKQYVNENPEEDKTRLSNIEYVKEIDGP